MSSCPEDDCVGNNRQEIAALEAKMDSARAAQLLDKRTVAEYAAKGDTVRVSITSIEKQTKLAWRAGSTHSIATRRAQNQRDLQELKKLKEKTLRLRLKGTVHTAAPPAALPTKPSEPPKPQQDPQQEPPSLSVVHRAAPELSLSLLPSKLVPEAGSNDARAVPDSQRDQGHTITDDVDVRATPGPQMTPPSQATRDVSESADTPAAALILASGTLVSTPRTAPQPGRASEDNGARTVMQSRNEESQAQNDEREQPTSVDDELAVQSSTEGHHWRRRQQTSGAAGGDGTNEGHVETLVAQDVSTTSVPRVPQPPAIGRPRLPLGEQSRIMGSTERTPTQNRLTPHNHAATATDMVCVGGAQPLARTRSGPSARYMSSQMTWRSRQQQREQQTAPIDVEPVRNTLLPPMENRGSRPSATDSSSTDAVVQSPPSSLQVEAVSLPVPPVEHTTLAGTGTWDPAGIGPISTLSLTPRLLTLDQRERWYVEQANKLNLTTRDKMSSDSGAIAVDNAAVIQQKTVDAPPVLRTLRPPGHRSHSDTALHTSRAMDRKLRTDRSVGSARCVCATPSFAYISRDLVF